MASRPGASTTSVPDYPTDEIAQSREGEGAKEEEGVREVGSGLYKINPDIWDGFLSNLEGVASQARILPTEDGVKIFAMRPGSFFHKMGLRNEDVIESINGVEVNSFDSVLTLFENLRNEQSLKIDIRRRGIKTTFEYTVE